MKPVSLFPFDDEFVGLTDVSGVWCISPDLRNRRKQIPSMRLAYSQSARRIRVLQFLHAYQPAVNVVL